MSEITEQPVIIESATLQTGPKHYAQLDNDSIVVAVSRLGGVIDAPNMIELDNIRQFIRPR